MSLQIEETGLLLIDVQEKLFPKIFGNEELEKVILQALHAFQILEIPIILTEQYPQGLGLTLPSIKEKIPYAYEKISFSALQNQEIEKVILEQKKKNWILIGIESHICILQSAMDLIEQNYHVVVLEDAVSSRNPLHKKIAIEEMRKKNIRISCLETCLFELLGHAKHSKFKEISHTLR